jgi:hypothetical protein
MADIVDLQSYRNKAFEERCFGAWRKRFREPLGADTRLSDLSDKAIYYLAQPGENSSTAYYEIIMGVLGLGWASKFHYLGNRDQMRVVDMHLFLADQVRFEMMKRIGWLRQLPLESKCILDLVQQFDRLKPACQESPPRLDPSHPGSESYRELSPRDKEVFIRRMLREALEVFRKRLEE